MTAPTRAEVQKMIAELRGIAHFVSLVSTGMQSPSIYKAADMLAALMPPDQPDATPAGELVTMSAGSQEAAGPASDPLLSRLRDTAYLERQLAEARAEIARYARPGEEYQIIELGSSGIHIGSDLDGMAAVADGVQQQKFPHTVDARIWATEFIKRFPDFDEADAIGWFANAIMAGYDTASMRVSREARAEIERLKAEVAQLNTEIHIWEESGND